MKPIIECNELTKKYEDITIKVSLKINRGEIFGLLGPNGAGKTTVISMLSTLLFPTTGTAKVCDFDIIKQANQVRKRIGLVFQETILDEDLTAWDNLEFQARLYKIQNREKKINQILKLVGLKDRKYSKVETFSGGMKRKLEIARGLLTNPKVLFLDEPTLGLDPKARRDIWDYIKKMNQKEITIILATHYMEEADYLCDRVGIMNQGKIVIIDKPKKLKNSLGGDMIEAELDNISNDLINRLEKVRYVKNIAQVNNSLKITVKNAEKKIEEMMDLIKKFTDIKSITLHKPTLDDVFLHYTGKKLENA